MSKKWLVAIAVVAIAAMVMGVSGSGAWWSIQTQAKDNALSAGTFDMTIGGTGGHEVSGLCAVSNWAPGDNPALCTINLHNGGSVPINVVWSGFQLTGDSTMQDWVFITDFADSNGQTSLADIMGFDSSPADGKLSIKEASGALANGYFSNPDGTDSHASLFLAPGADGYVSLELAFGAEAPNATIGKSVGFTWTLTAQQLPQNSTP